MKRAKTPAAPSTARDDDAPLEETLVEASIAWSGRFLDVRLDRVRLPDGNETAREYIVHSGAVMVVPIVDDHHVVMERQFRWPMRRVMLEFPAGKLDANESPFACGRRELREETGFRAAEWARAGITHNAIAYSTEGIHIWFARGLEAGAASLDAGEFLQVCTVADTDLEAGVRSGSITDAKTLAGLLYLQHWRAGRWPLEWVAAPADV